MKSAGVWLLLKGSFCAKSGRAVTGTEKPAVNVLADSTVYSTLAHRIGGQMSPNPDLKYRGN